MPWVAMEKGEGIPMVEVDMEVVAGATPTGTTGAGQFTRKDFWLGIWAAACCLPLVSDDDIKHSEFSRNQGKLVGEVSYREREECHRNRGPTVHLRGLPYRCSESEVAAWLAEAASPVEVIINLGRPVCWGSWPCRGPLLQGRPPKWFRQCHLRDPKRCSACGEFLAMKLTPSSTILS